MRGERFLKTIAGLPSPVLLERVRQLHGASNRVLADLIAHLAQVQERRLFRELAFSSMFHYLTAGLGFDEGAAMMRIKAARVVLVHPFVLDLLAEGQLHLTGVSLLAPHLDRDGTGADLIREAVGKSRRQIEALLAERFPKPDVAPMIRRLPRPGVTIGGAGADPSTQSAPPSQADLQDRTQTAGPVGRPSAGQGAEPAPATAMRQPALRAGSTADARPSGSPVTLPPPANPIAAPTRAGSGEVAPLGADRFKVQFMATGEQVERLRELQDLLSHQVPTGDLAEVLDQAVTALRDALLKKRLGARKGGPARDVGGAGEAERVEAGHATREITDPGIGSCPPDDITDPGIGSCPPGGITDPRISSCPPGDITDPGIGSSAPGDITDPRISSCPPGGITDPRISSCPPGDITDPRISSCPPGDITDPRISSCPPGGITDAGDVTVPGIGSSSDQTQRGPASGEMPRAEPAPTETEQPADPTAGPASRGNPRSRYISKPVRRAVFERDGHRCTYVDATGRRCDGTRFLTLDHAPVPFARGGPSTVDNLQVRCWAHNQETAWKQLGPRHMERRIEAQRRAAPRDGATCDLGSRDARTS